jgi:hypothetical protein
MATYSKQLLSGSTNGRPIIVAASATAGTLIHTSVSGSASLDEVWLYATNTSVSSVKVTVEFGGTSTSDQIEVSVPGESGLFLLVPGLIINNSLVVRAFAGTVNVINICGYVNRIS